MSVFFSGPRNKKQHKHKLCVSDFPWTFLSFMPGYPRVKELLPITGAAEKRTFGCRCQRLSARMSMTWRVLEKLCTGKVCVILRDGEATIKIQFSLFEGWGPWRQMGNATTIKVWKCKFYCRDIFAVIVQAPIFFGPYFFCTPQQTVHTVWGWRILVGASLVRESLLRACFLRGS